jgi:hypothetical protein
MIRVSAPPPIRNQSLAPMLDEMYTALGRSSIRPERSLEASLLMALYMVCSGAYCGRRATRASRDRYQSQTDPMALVYRKSKRHTAQVSYLANVMMDNTPPH